MQGSSGFPDEMDESVGRLRENFTAVTVDVKNICRMPKTQMGPYISEDLGPHRMVLGTTPPKIVTPRHLFFFVGIEVNLRVPLFLGSRPSQYIHP